MGFILGFISGVVVTIIATIWFAWYMNKKAK